MRTRSEAFNEWMRRYIEEPEKFKSDWQNVVEFLESVKAEEVPSYGEECEIFLAKLEAGE